jgi:hypothetical protein
VLTEAKSAKAPGRLVFNSMMECLYRGEPDGILCWKLDRLARNPVDGGAIIWAMKEHGVKIISSFQVYGQSEDNVVWMYLEFGMVQKYVDDLSKTVKRGLRAKAEAPYQPSIHLLDTSCYTYQPWRRISMGGIPRKNSYMLTPSPPSITNGRFGGVHLV